MIRDADTPPPPPADRALLDRTAQWIRQAYADGINEALTGIVEYRRESGTGLRVLRSRELDERAKQVFMASMQYLSARNASPRSAIAYESWIVESDDPAQIRKAQRMLERGQSISKHPFAREMVMVNVESEAGSTMLRLDIDRSGDRIELTDHSPPIHMPRDGGGPLQGGGLLSGFHVPFTQRIDPSFLSWCARMDTNARSMMTEEG